MQPVIVAVLFPGARVWWGLCWYAIALGAVIAVLRIPQYLRRPAALLFVALAPVVATILTGPSGFAWLPAVPIAKLVLGAVREEPYRPAPRSGDLGPMHDGAPASGPSTIDA